MIRLLSHIENSIEKKRKEKKRKGKERKGKERKRLTYQKNIKIVVILTF